MRIGLPPAMFMAIVLALPAVADPPAADRVALVIGNSDYEQLTTLVNPVRDAAAVADRLAELGFTLIGVGGQPATNRQGPATVRAVEDVSGDAFASLLDDFARAAQGAQIAFFYYAGHGMQIGFESYLLPVDAPATDLAAVEKRSQTLESVLRRLDGRVQLTLAVFDACREIPELKTAIDEATRGAGLAPRGLRGLERAAPAPNPRIVAYSAAAGQFAADGVDLAHSPYTESLLAELAHPEQEIGDLFRQAAARLGRHGQQPEVLIQGVPAKRFYLVQPVDVVEPAEVGTGSATVKPGGGLVSTVTELSTAAGEQPIPGLRLDATRNGEPHAVRRLQRGK